MTLKDCMGERLAKIETSIEYIKKEQLEQKELLTTFINSADKKYASKLTETLVYTMAGVMLLTIIAALLKLVIIG